MKNDRQITNVGGAMIIWLYAYPMEWCEKPISPICNGAQTPLLPNMLQVHIQNYIFLDVSSISNHFIELSTFSYGF